MLRRAALRLPSDQLVGTSTRVIVPAVARSYATKSSSSSGAKKTSAKGNRGQVDQADSRTDLIRKTLYESSPSDASRLEALSRVVPSAEVHETITRAWTLHQRQKREAHEASLRRKYAAMQTALTLLKDTSKELYDKAVGGKKFQNVDQEGAGNEGLVGLVPREMRAPMELAGSVRWDAEWKRPVIEGEAQPKK